MTTPVEDERRLWAAIDAEAFKVVVESGAIVFRTRFGWVHIYVEREFHAKPHPIPGKTLCGNFYSAGMLRPGRNPGFPLRRELSLSTLEAFREGPCSICLQRATSMIMPGDRRA